MRRLLWASLVVLLVSAPVSAQWWRFWRPKASPVVSSAFALTLTVPAATDCTKAAVQIMLDAITAAGANQIGGIPAGTCRWTSGITWTSPSNTTIIGAGSASLSTLGGAGTTVLVDDIATNNPILGFVNGGGTLRIAGLTIEGGDGILKDNDVFYITSTTRVDHVTLNSQTYTTGAKTGQKIFTMYGAPSVLDHSIVKVSGNSAVYIWNNEGAGHQGDEIWAADTNFGNGDSGASWSYIEDNEFRGDITGSASRVLDCFKAGSKVAVRFNTLYFVHGPEVHATSSTDSRGCRAMENYNNYYTTLPSQPTTGYDLHDGSSGTALVWGNVADDMARGVVMGVIRESNTTYGEYSTPLRFGYCGTNFLSATVNTTNVANSAVHATSFPNSPGWTGGSGQTTYAVVADAIIRINGVDYTVLSVTDADDLVITTNAGAQSGVSGNILSNWDGAPTAQYGYPCLDQPGRGKGDLLTGSFPTKVNSSNGGIITSARQALEPIYVWKNTVTPLSVGMYPADANRVVADRDYYAQPSGIQTNATTPFNGTTGTGWGTLANRPTTCTAGVFYFATDQGSWNTTSSNTYGVQQNGADGLGYKCTSTNTWTLYYTPYTYPHPLAVP